MEEQRPYETLDPENWDEMRELAHRVVDDAVDWFRTTRERPAWHPVPSEVAERLTARYASTEYREEHQRWVERMPSREVATGEKLDELQNRPGVRLIFRRLARSVTAGEASMPTESTIRSKTSVLISPFSAT